MRNPTRNASPVLPILVQMAKQSPRTSSTTWRMFGQSRPCIRATANVSPSFRTSIMHKLAPALASIWTTTSYLNCTKRSCTATCQSRMRIMRTNCLLKRECDDSDPSKSTCRDARTRTAKACAAKLKDSRTMKSASSSPCLALLAVLVC